MADDHVMHHHPTRTETRGLSVFYALFVGGFLTIIGIAGFFVDAHFDSVHQKGFLGLWDVNGWFDTVHLVAGLLGLLSVRLAPRAYAGILGVFWIVYAVWGFYNDLGDDVVSGLPSSVGANWLHLALGILGIAAAAHGYFVSDSPRHDDHAAGTGRGF